MAVWCADLWVNWVWHMHTGESVKPQSRHDAMAYHTLMSHSTLSLLLSLSLVLNLTQLCIGPSVRCCFEKIKKVKTSSYPPTHLYMHKHVYIHTHKPWLPDLKTPGSKEKQLKPYVKHLEPVFFSEIIKRNFHILTTDQQTTCWTLFKCQNLISSYSKGCVREIR